MTSSSCVPSARPSQQVALAIKKEPLTLKVYSEGTIKKKMNIAPGSELYGFLSSWVARNPNHWRRSYDTFAPGYLVAGVTFVLNVRHDFLVLNYSTDGLRWSQVKEPTPNDFWQQFSDRVKQLEGADSN
jgi:hypothetical protein